MNTAPPTLIRSPYFPPVLIALVTVAAFLPALSAGFTNWDDEANFVHNPNYRGLSAEHLKWMFSTFVLGHYHPLTWITLGLDYIIWGMNPFGYHLTSLLVHSANAALLYFVIAALLRLCGRGATPWPAALGALFYALHPLRVESVAWVTERRDVLCGFFILLSVLAYLKRVEEERQGRTWNRWLALSLAAFAASLLSKALGILLPAVLLVLDVYPLGRFVAGARRRVLLEKGAFALLSCADAAVMIFAMRDIQAVRSLGSYNVLERAAQAAYGLCFYLVKTVWPSGLIPLYRIDEPMNPGAAKYVLAMTAVAILAALLFALRRRVPAATAAALAYALLVLPVLGVAVTGMQIAADRYTYLALIPASLLLSVLLDGRLRPAAFAGAALLLAALSVATWRQCGYWKDSITLWSRQIEIDPGTPIAYLNRGQARHERGDASGALEDYNACLRLKPEHDQALANRGSTRLDLGDAAGARADYDRCLEINPRYFKALNLRGLLREKQGDAAGARADYDRALKIHPGHVLALTNRGFLRRAQNDVDGAFADAETALRHDPASTAAFVLRASVHRARGNLQAALADLDRAIGGSARSLEAFNNRAVLHMQLGRTREALRDYESALQLRPDNPAVLVGRGQARQVLGDRPGAAVDFERALRVAPAGWPLRAEVQAMLERARR